MKKILVGLVFCTLPTLSLIEAMQKKVPMTNQLLAFLWKNNHIKKIKKKMCKLYSGELVFDASTGLLKCTYNYAKYGHDFYKIFSIDSHKLKIKDRGCCLPDKYSKGLCSHCGSAKRSTQLHNDSFQCSKNGTTTWVYAKDLHIKLEDTIFTDKAFDLRIGFDFYNPLFKKTVIMPFTTLSYAAHKSGTIAVLTRDEENSDAYLQVFLPCVDSTTLDLYEKYLQN